MSENRKSKLPVSPEKPEDDHTCPTSDMTPNAPADVSPARSPEAGKPHCAKQKQSLLHHTAIESKDLIKPYPVLTDSPKEKESPTTKQPPVNRLNLQITLPQTGMLAALPIHKTSPIISLCAQRYEKPCYITCCLIDKRCNRADPIWTFYLHSLCCRPILRTYFFNISLILSTRDVNSSSLYKRVNFTIRPSRSISTLRVMPESRSAYLAKMSAPESNPKG